MLWLVVVNCLVFAYQSTLQPLAAQLFVFRYGLSGMGLEQGAFWQLITHAFLHGNFWHLLVNMLSLWFAGRSVEWYIGPRKFLALYLLSAVGGGVLQMAWGPSGVELIGASGAVFGVVLAFTTIFYDQQIIALLFFVIPLRLKARYLGIGLLAITFLSMVFHFQSWIGHAAHLGGAITGYLFARALGYGAPTFPERLIGKLIPR